MRLRYRWGVRIDGFTLYSTNWLRYRFWENTPSNKQRFEGWMFLECDDTTPPLQELQRCLDQHALDVQQ